MSVWLIYAREMRDQFRDRRTLFTIVVLPMLLYPLVGTLLLQIVQFTQQHTTRVCVIGTEHLEGVPPLVGNDCFDESVVGEDKQLAVVTYPWREVMTDRTVYERAEDWVRSGTYDAAVMIPKDFLDSKDSSRDSSIQIVYNVASDPSMVARDRVSKILGLWRDQWIRDRLSDSGIDIRTLQPFHLANVDIAPERTREAALWSKLLPFIMLIWAMTGAFYPAIDLVAGEKERGTLETLLCSPALRSEIVAGKLFAVTTFSMLTAILNAVSMLVTSSFVFQHIGVGSGVGAAIGAPPVGPMLWLFVALVPLSTLFSALALAVAAMAKSSKEGQYYLMPLMMVTLPLVLLPMLPGTTLSVGTSVIPVTGMFLLVRALVEGQYAFALWHFPMVAGVTAVCLWLAARWAQKQFENESVLFGGNEQWELRGWMRHLWRDRVEVASPAQAMVCGVIILVGLFFGKLAVQTMPTDFAGIVRLVMTPQIGFILAPTLVMAVMLTTSVRQSLRLRMPHWTTIPLAVLVGITLHPSYVLLATWIRELYPVSEQTLASMKPFTDQISQAPWLSVVMLMAVVPAICEELTFRGFIFGGLERFGGGLRAIIVTALLFGISHGVLQQSISAALMGLLLGWVALKTQSVLPCILIHVTNNALSVSMERVMQSGWRGADVFIRSTSQGPEYQPLWIVVSMAVTVTLLIYFATLGEQKKRSESLAIQPCAA